MGGVDNLHLTLEQVLLELKKALATIKKEKDLFQKMKQIYRGADMPSKFGIFIKLIMVAFFRPYQRTTRETWRTNYPKVQTPD